MRLSRTNIALVVILLAQIILVAFLYLSDDDAEGTSLARGGSLVQNFDPEAYTSLILEDDSGQQIELGLVDGAWVLPSADNYPAQSARIQELLNTIERIQANRLVTRTASSHRRLQVAEDAFYRKLILRKADGSTTTLYVGSSGGGRTRHVRLEGEDAVYLTDEIAAGQLDPIISSWVNTVYFTIAADSLRQITIENANGITTLNREEGVWRVEGLAPNRVTDTVAVNPITNNLSNFRLTEPLGTEALPEYGLDAPLATVTIVAEVPDPNALTTDDETEGMIEGAPTETPTETPEPPTILQTTTLLIGASTDAGYYAKYSESPYYVIISTTAGNLFVNATPDGLATDQIFSVFGG